MNELFDIAKGIFTICFLICLAWVSIRITKKIDEIDKGKGAAP